MKKTPSAEQDPELIAEYDFSHGVRGKYVERLARGSNLIVLSPDVATAFPTSEAVNDALRLLIKVANTARQTPGASTRKARGPVKCEAPRSHCACKVTEGGFYQQPNARCVPAGNHPSKLLHASTCGVWHPGKAKKLGLCDRHHYLIVS